MDEIDARIRRVERAVTLLSDLRDPAKQQFPLTGSDPRTRQVNKAEQEFAALAQELRRELQVRQT